MSYNLASITTLNDLHNLSSATLPSIQTVPSATLMSTTYRHVAYKKLKQLID